MNVRRVLEYVAGLVLLLLVGGAGTFGVELTTPARGCYELDLGVE
jgi:hypothetical protein